MNILMFMEEGAHDTEIDELATKPFLLCLLSGSKYM